MYKTIVGYAGGKKDNPNYHDIGNHSEAIQVYFEPEEITYKDLIELFWEKHNPFREAWSTQYASIVFYHNESQKQVAIDTKGKLEETTTEKIHTKIEPYTKFYQAENYHQKYYLQMTKELYTELRGMHTTFQEFISSSVAARVNGYIKGCGSIKRLEQELHKFGLSTKAQKRIKDIVCGYGR